MKPCFLLALLPPCLLLSACLEGMEQLGASSARSQAHSQAAHGARAGSNLSATQWNRIGMRIWENESGGSYAGLTSWNAGEGFLSLGIGHFIWFPAGYQGVRFSESFPALVDYLARNGKRPPAWLHPNMPCPWPSKAAFEREKNSPRARELRDWLAASVSEQTAFIALRLERSLPLMLQNTAPANRPRVQQHFQQLSQSPEGMFALIDYVNFKGEGTNPAERYRGQGWGLLQVLEGMRAATTTEFARSADAVLTRRVANAPAARGEGRWLAGWRNRVYRYEQPL